MGVIQSMGKRIAAKPGDRFGRLVVIEEVESHRSLSGRPRRQMKCLCDCGTISTVILERMTSGESRSCGCLKREVMAQAWKKNVTHGQSGTPTYKAWDCMRQRCNNPSNKAYSDYGGRGITVCERWMTSFDSFLEDVGVRPTSAHSLDRYPNLDGNYEPGNVRWATWKEQNQNRRNNMNLTLGDETLCVAEWSRRTNIHSDTIRYRIRQGWTVEDALTTPAGHKRKARA